MPQRDPPFGRLVEAGDAVEDGGLARAVRADQRCDVAAAGLEGEVADGDEAAEAHGQMLDREDRVGIPALRGVAVAHQPWPCETSPAPMRFFCFSATDGTRLLMRPRGFHTMMITMASPKISMR